LRGWLGAVRTALRRSKSEVARKLNVTPSTVLRYESSEAAGTITLETLRRYADALGCDLVYGLVPRTGSLESFMRQRAEHVAAHIIGNVTHSMALEAQAPAESFVQNQIDELTEELLSTQSAEIWQDV